MSKKIMALVLALAMVFSTITVAFAEEPVAEAVAEEVAEVSAEAKALGTIGMLEGAGDGLTAEYTATELNRLTAAIMILKLKGLYEDALKYEGENNFVDVEELKWEDGKKILAYVKDNPVGFGGNEKGEFKPYDTLSEQMLYKVLLENLGYKQVTADVADGDFAWEETLEFAEKLGLKPAKAEKFTVDGLAKAVVAALKTDMKDGKAWIEVLVENGKVDEDKAVAAGLMEEAPVVTAALKSAKALGNTVVEVKFDAAINEGAEDVALYTIEGLEVKSAVVADEKVVRLETAAQKAGTLYTLVVGDVKVKFTGIAKVSGGPELTDAVSEDVEEVVLTFDKVLDFETATDIANYSIAKVEITDAEVDGKKVTLTTVGLKDKTSYTVKVTNIKSIDGVTRKSTSKSFKTRVDKAAPRINLTETKVETNQRIVLYFNEPVTKESAEDLANYTIKENKTDGAELEILSVVWDEDDEDNVEIVTEAQTYNTYYKLTVNNIADQKKVANVMTRPATFTFKGLREDTKAPTFENVKVIARNLLVVEFADDSRIDEESALDTNNYTLTTSKEDLNVEDAEKLSSKKFLITVEDMEAGKNYNLKVADILDEFGNAMREKTRSFKANLTDFASAQLTGYEINSKNKITLTFNKDLNKETAKNIANYSINKGIGTPIKATYEDDNNTIKVVLEVNELTNGESYKVTVDGVEDLAGNVLKVTIDSLKAVADSKWDEEPPELEDAYVLNKFVVALQFSEKVKYEKDTTKLKLTHGEDGEAILFAKAYADEDTVIEFSSSTDLKPEITYTVYGIIAGSIKDLAGNPFKLVEGDMFTFEGSKDVPEAAYVETYEQVNGGTFDLTMSKNVKFKDGTVVNEDDEATIKDKNDKEFTVTIDKNVVSFVGTIKQDVKYEFDLKSFLVDEHSYDVENYDEESKTVLVGEYTDEDKPYIVDVVAVDRETIEIEFSEDIKEVAAANFKIKNIDTDKVVGIASGDLDIDGAVVTLKLASSAALEGRYQYELTMSDKVVKDFAGNVADKDTFVFDGTDLAPLGIDD